MSRLIDADALIGSLHNYGFYDGNDREMVYRVIQLQPTIVPERKTGKWIEDGYNHYKAVCNQCGEPCGTYIMGDPRDRFCKWCGAKMEEGDNT